MNWENIKTRYAEVGLPILMLGCIIYAVGLIVEYLVQTIYGISHPVINGIIFFGMILIVIGAFSVVLLVKHI